MIKEEEVEYRWRGCTGTCTCISICLTNRIVGLVVLLLSLNATFENNSNTSLSL